MDSIFEVLSQKGLSKTQVRIDILQIFVKSKKPISITDFKESPKFRKVTESSIYRNLNRFEEAGIIRTVPSSSGFQFFELVSKDKHHHHIVCDQCKKIQCLSVCDIEKELLEMAQKSGFQLKGHSLELFGTCRECLN